MRKPNVSRYASFAGFFSVLLAVEMASRLIAPSLPIDPGKWPRVEIAQKLEQMRSLSENGEQVDVLFVGSSMMAGGIDPVRFTEASGISSYNAAFAGPSLRSVTPWTLDIVVPLLEPEVVVVGVQSRELSDNAIKNIKFLETFLASPGYRETASTIAARVGGRLERLSAFLKNRRVLREPSQLLETDLGDPLAGVEVRRTLGPRGRRDDGPATYHGGKFFRRTLYEKTLKDFEIGGPELAALRELEEGLSERGIRLVLLSTPVTEDYWASHEDPVGDRLEYWRVIGDFAETHGLTLIAADSAFPDKEQQFRDPIHLDLDARGALAEALGRHWDEILARGSSKISEASCTPGLSSTCSVD